MSYGEEVPVIDDLAQEFYQAAHNWQQNLDAMMQAGEPFTLVLQTSIEQELDTLCPYIGERVLLKGFGILPVIDEDSGEFAGNTFGHHEAGGQHLGVRVLSISGMDEHFRPQEKPGDDTTLVDATPPIVRVLHMVYLGGDLEPTSPTFQTSHSYFGLFHLDSHLVLLDEVEESFRQPELPAANLELLLDTSREFRSMLCSTPFRRLKHRQQRQRVDEVLKEANQKLSLLDADLSVMCDYFHRPCLETSFGGALSFMPTDVPDLIINGTCLGVDSIEGPQLANRPIRRDRDLQDKLAGLCLVLDPDEESRHALQLADQQVVYIPTLSQAIDIA